MIVRPAETADGYAIEELLRGDGQYIEGVDYSDVSGYWLVGEREGEIISCVQLVPSRPIAHVAFFVVAERFRNGTVTWTMTSSVLEVLRSSGASHVAGFLYRGNKSWANALVRHGTVKITGKGSIYIRSTETLIPMPRTELLEIA